MAEPATLHARPQPVVIDASVWVAFFLRADANHVKFYQWINKHTSADGELFAPTILLAEAASAVGRRTGKTERSLNTLSTLEAFTLLNWVQMEHGLIREAAQVAAMLGLRGADAIYVVTAKKLNLPLLTLDNEQLTRGAAIATTIRP